MIDISELQRYELDPGVRDEYEGEMVEDSDGDYVLIAEVEKLIDKLIDKAEAGKLM